MLTCKKFLGFAMALVLTLSGAAMALDAYEAARDAAQVESGRIDNTLQNIANHLNTELDQSIRQEHEAQRLGQSTDVANQYGSGTAIDRQIQSTADEANRMLAAAKERDDYTMQRRELQNNQSLYYPGSPQYLSFDERIRELDRQFANTQIEERGSLGNLAK